MKKYLIILSMFLIVCGCGKTSDENVVKKFQDKIEKNNSYTLKGTMSIESNEDTFTYDVEASKSKDDYYKVSLVNKTNDHQQVILKNNDGVYVVTPDLNKSFKFQSDWPYNGSQSYLLDILVNDVLNDNEVYIGSKDNKKYIQAKVNYPNNSTLYSEKIYLDNDYGVEKVEVLDQDGNTKITLDVKTIDYKPKFSKDYFDLDSLINNSCNGECKEKTTEEISNNNTETTSNILDDIIYPLYVPQNTYLNTEDTIETDNGARAILTFTGDSPFVIIEEASRVYDEMEIVPVNGEPLIMSDCIGAMSANSLYWSSNGIDYYISSTSLNSQELMTIAEGLTGSSIIVSAEK